MKRRGDPVGVVEAAYDFRAPEVVWLERIVESARPLLDDGLGMMGFVVEPVDGGALSRSPVALGGAPEWRRDWRTDWWERVIEPMPREVLRRLVSFAPVMYASIAGQALSRDIDTFGEFLETVAAKGIRGQILGHALPDRAEPRGVFYPEAFAVCAIDATGHGVTFGASRAEVARRPPSRAEHRTWNRVAAHVAAAHRIRRRLHGAEPIETADAVVTPRGKVLHAGSSVPPSSIEALRQAALDVDRARSMKVRETDDALELWRALHDGKWSIVDTFDSDGRRFLIARANEPAARRAQALSKREQQVIDLLALGHSNKLIAYDLGISVSSVATHLRRAATKLRLHTTRDLVRWARARRRPEEGEGERESAE